MSGTTNLQLAAISVGHGKELRIELALFKRRHFVALRIYEQLKGGWFPKKGQGLTFSSSACESVCEALRAALVKTSKGYDPDPLPYPLPFVEPPPPLDMTEEALMEQLALLDAFWKENYPEKAAGFVAEHLTGKTLEKKNRRKPRPFAPRA